ncbi:LysR family transcriptional regulator [Roseospira marina]|uniref:LysR family transcriptional regulator n=1 Tax=Roseospira marina TaxID=140057 RepID=A0A5M6IDA3_9PROT|nr:LysR family transcriptional regulator [Roseospira marina]KAA5605715.1 LysR family transcriptional regulator [Roseospira marina]MBB4313515.1 DNA-binding transcriptional LysR family regulator [Roseospira marina]MBB5086677.1 DNA-binding transcriptional LysR family regulator [Roseospira marina]
MTLDQLRLFVAVAERQHLTQAARALNVAQSAASHAIAALEARHGTRLFDRVGRRIVLTEAGRAFLDQARLVLTQADRAERTLNEFGTLARGTLAVHASQTIAGSWLPRHLVAFRRVWPGVMVRLSIGNTAQVADAVDSGRADVGFVEGAVAAETLERRLVARDRLVAVVGPEHEWCGRESLDAATLASGAWVLREPGSGTRAALETALAGLGVPTAQLQVALELPSNEAVRAAVEAGLGATALSASVVAPSLEAGLLQALPLRLPDRAYHVVLHRHRPPGRAGGALLALMGLDAVSG